MRPALVFLLLLVPLAFLHLAPRTPACTLYVLTFHALAWPIVFLAPSWKLRAAAYVVLAVGSARQWAHLGVHSEFFGHVIAGIALIRGGAGVLRTEHGGPMRASLPTGLLGVAIFVVASVLQINTTLWRHGMTCAVGSRTTKAPAMARSFCCSCSASACPLAYGASRA